ncbi:MAG: glycosyltransferase [Bacteroidetes bacterium]|nr:glycosyltransferase [Bacteroidota bacterium]
MKATVSLCMIVKNEEQFLPGCLESAQPFVDEIIIVDTGSTDRTKEIALQYNAHLYQFSWNGNFSDARNESIKRATSDWILYLDADERLTEGFRIREIVNNNSVFAYSLLIRGKHLLPSGEVEQVNAYPRLFRRHPKIFFEGEVHEQISPSLERLKKSIVAASIVIEHLGYGQSLEIVQEKCRRNAALLENQLAKNHRDHYARYQLGNTFVVMQEYEQAEKHLRQVLSSSIGRSIKATACNLLVEICVKRNDLEIAVEWCKESLRYINEQSMARWFLSGILAHNKKYEDALTLLKHLDKQYAIGKTQLAHDIVLTKTQIYERMNYCYEMLSHDTFEAKNIEGAERWISEAEKNNIYSYSLQRRGIETALTRKDIRSANSRLSYVINNLPEEFASQREKFSAIQEKLRHLSAAEKYLHYD